MKKFVTYPADNMIISRDRCADSGKKYGADEVYAFHSKHDVSEEFYNTNKEILDAEFCENGTRPCNGYWLTKPYFINRVMNQSQDGDYVIYADAGCEIIAPLQAIIDVMDEDLFLFSNGMMHRDWCKADVIDEILHITPPHGIHEWEDNQQVQASALWIKVTPFSRKFIKEWLLWCQMPGMVDDSPSDIPNHPEFASHRYDQAILCCLQIKYGLKTHWWPDARWFASQRYRWPNDQYPLMLVHHRMRNNEW